MEDGVDFSGKTVEDAIVQAEARFGEKRSNLDIEVLAPGRSGVFGIGAENARVQVRRRRAVTASVMESTTAAPAHGAATEERELEPERTVTETNLVRTREDIPSAGAGKGDLPAEAAEVLRQLLRSMGFDADVTIRSEEDPVMLAITGANLGVLIGRRGDNLSALQFMVNLILSKNRRQWPRVVVDVENYRARREESLRSLADRIAYRVRRNQRPFTLEAMPAGDRRAIHLSLRDASDVETYSIGEGVARRVVIAPKRDAVSPAARS